MTRLNLKPGECALVQTQSGLRIRGDHTLSEQEEQVLLTKLNPEIKNMPTPENGTVLYTFTAGSPEEIEITDEWNTVLETTDDKEQRTLEDYSVDIETYLRNEIKKAVPRAVEEYRTPF